MKMGKTSVWKIALLLGAAVAGTAFLLPQAASVQAAAITAFSAGSV